MYPAAIVELGLPKFSAPLFSCNSRCDQSAYFDSLKILICDLIKVLGI
jgi:hypothetical protein